MEKSSHTFFRSKNTEMFDVLKKQIKKTQADVDSNIRRFPCLLTIFIFYLPGM